MVEARNVFCDEVQDDRIDQKPEKQTQDLYPPSSSCLIFAANAGVIPLTAAISSSPARRMPAGDPKAESRRLRRTGPTPASASSAERVIDLARLCRWYVTAKRCASSRTLATR